MQIPTYGIPITSRSWGENAQEDQHVLDGLVIEVSRYGAYFLWGNGIAVGFAPESDRAVPLIIDGFVTLDRTRQMAINTRG